MNKIKGWLISYLSCPIGGKVVSRKNRIGQRFCYLKLASSSSFLLALAHEAGPPRKHQKYERRSNNTQAGLLYSQPKIQSLEQWILYKSVQSTLVNELTKFVCSCHLLGDIVIQPVRSETSISPSSCPFDIWRSKQSHMGFDRLSN